MIFEPMSSADFDHWYLECVRGYAEAKCRAGAWTPEDSLEKSKAETGRILYQGQSTPGQGFLNAVVDGEVVGTVWHGDQVLFTGIKAFVWDITVRPDLRGQGIGQKIMKLLFLHLKALGYQEVGLNVFGYNEAAIRLYNSLGFEVTSQQMNRQL